MPHRWMFFALLAVLTGLGWSGVARSGATDELIAGAKKEGTIEYYGPSTLTPHGAQALGDAFNKKYGLNISLKYSPSGNMIADVSKVVGMGRERGLARLGPDGGHRCSPRAFMAQEATRAVRL